jgi:DNA mismatch repair protein MutL
MDKKVTLNKLPQELVNQIAAGEVIERPASVIKELLDNSIDAGSTKIGIKVVNGGIDLIEVSDNGMGIPGEDIEDIFKAHTTSKISTLEDLNSLLTMGFRGEALSTIVSVSKVKMSSKYIDEEFGNEILFKNFSDSSVKKSARESGTVITVENIFDNIPVRKKFLKSAQTEYKRIVEVLIPYFLIYPNIHFILQKDSKVVYDLRSVANSKPNTVSMERLEQVIKDDFVKRMVKLFYDGSGVKISGFSAHPSDHQKRVLHQYLFVNGRPVRDNGVTRSIFQGYERYIPHGERVPYVVLININPDLVDINVHPRKEEIRFLNPFRVYSAVEEAVKKSISGVTSYRMENREFKPVTQEKTYSKSPKDITFDSSRTSSVRDSLLFSKEALSNENYIDTLSKDESQKESFTKYEGEISNKKFRNIFQIFNKYIVIEFEDNNLWIIDQHAAAERITFEKLKNSKKGSIEKQTFLVPFEVNLTDSEIIVMEELKEFFNNIGIDYTIEKSGIKITSSPVEFIKADFKIVFDEVFALSDDTKSIANEIERLKEDIYATVACHSSVRSGQFLHREEMIDIYKNLSNCENPYSCPHGRPAVWKLTLSEIDKNFERTY